MKKKMLAYLLIVIVVIGYKITLADVVGEEDLAYCDTPGIENVCPTQPMGSYQRCCYTLGVNKDMCACASWSGENSKCVTKAN